MFPKSFLSLADIGVDLSQKLDKRVKHAIRYTFGIGRWWDYECEIFDQFHTLRRSLLVNDPVLERNLRRLELAERLKDKKLIHEANLRLNRLVPERPGLLAFRQKHKVRDLHRRFATNRRRFHLYCKNRDRRIIAALQPCQRLAVCVLPNRFVAQLRQQQEATRPPLPTITASPLITLFCNLCNKRCTSTLYMERHLAGKTHQMCIASAPSSQIKNYECAVCKRTFKTANRLHTHLESKEHRKWQDQQPSPSSPLPLLLYDPSTERLPFSPIDPPPQRAIVASMLVPPGSRALAVPVNCVFLYWAHTYGLRVRQDPDNDDTDPFDNGTPLYIPYAIDFIDDSFMNLQPTAFSSYATLLVIASRIPTTRHQFLYTPDRKSGVLLCSLKSTEGIIGYWGVHVRKLLHAYVLKQLVWFEQNPTPTTHPFSFEFHYAPTKLLPDMRTIASQLECRLERGAPPRNTLLVRLKVYRSFMFRRAFTPLPHNPLS